MNRQFHIFPTPWGWMGMVAGKGRISRIILPQRSSSSCLRLLKGERPSGKGKALPLAVHKCGRHWAGRAGRDARMLKEAERQLLAYLKRERQKLALPLDLSQGTDFQQRVWKEARKIPYGETRSYQWLAHKVKKGRRPASLMARAVGNAMGANPLPIVVPCHRIIGKNGDLGGFGAGLPLKRRLLALEKGLRGLA